MVADTTAASASVRSATISLYMNYYYFLNNSGWGGGPFCSLFNGMNIIQFLNCLLRMASQVKWTVSRTSFVCIFKETFVRTIISWYKVDEKMVNISALYMKTCGLDPGSVTILTHSDFIHFFQTKALYKISHQLHHRVFCTSLYRNTGRYTSTTYATAALYYVLY